jgi:transposase InsO family protein
VLVEWKVLEQRHKAVIDVLGGVSVTEVARRYGVARQTVHDWLRRYAKAGGVVGLADHSCKPSHCPHQMPAEVEARVCALRRQHPGWGPARLLHELGKAGVDPLPGRSSIYRALLRHHLIEPHKRRRQREDFKRWERARSMELWQMDVMGGVKIAEGAEASIVTGIDDHSRFCVCARIVARATARPVCDALSEAMRRHGVPEGVLTDNGKVFTARFGPGTGDVLFDKILAANGVRHLLTAPYSPTTTGKVERFHKTLRLELLAGKVFATIDDAQKALDAWVTHYNTERPHQGIGMVAPIERFRLANTKDSAPFTEPAPEPLPRPRSGQKLRAGAGLGVGRWVDPTGKISIGGFKYHVGKWLAGELVEVLCADGVVEITHKGVLVASHAQRFRAGKPEKEKPAPTTPPTRKPRLATAGMTVTRIADNSGYVSFAGTMYRVGRAHRNRRVQVTVVGASVQLAIDGKVVRVHPATHDPAKEFGAFARPNGRPGKHQLKDPLPVTGVREVPDTNCRSGTGT